MTNEHFSIRVERAPHNMFAWAIMEQRGPMEYIEVAGSLKTYAKPSDAVLAAEQVLGVLVPRQEEGC
ncbi:hypothetical protein [Variovorax sp. GT1P44]|uniref:hypothetical protein n=1 Tax=Variovorax sp. GT1P44 TaxID=3443742 RepID=UPI003F48686B